MRILVVDDDRDYLRLLGSRLEARGHDVLSAGDGKEARELLDTEHADLIVSDVVMPTLDGIWFHSFVRDFSDEPDVPFIFISSPDDVSPSDLVVNPGIDLSLNKMMGLEELVGQIEGFGKRERGRVQQTKDRRGNGEQ